MVQTQVDMELDHGSRAACALTCARADCSCTDGARVLAIDASHLYVLLRAARILSPNAVKLCVLALLDAHSCNEGRHLVSSDHLVANEIAVMPEAGHARELASFLNVDDVEARLSRYDDSQWDRLPTHCPDGGRVFGEGDRRLVACAESASVQLDEYAYIATDDEDLIMNIYHCFDESFTAVIPVASVTLLLHLVQCGALGAEHLEAVLEAEDLRLQGDTVMQERKRRAKEERLDNVAATLAMMSA